MSDMDPDHLYVCSVWCFLADGRRVPAKVLMVHGHAPPSYTVMAEGSRQRVEWSQLQPMQPEPQQQQPVLPPAQSDKQQQDELAAAAAKVEAVGQQEQEQQQEQQQKQQQMNDPRLSLIHDYGSLLITVCQPGVCRPRPSLQEPQAY